MTLTDRFGEALNLAEMLHRNQTRKGNDIPYVAHLLAVAAMVLEWGGDEDTAIAALLHDAVEDQGGEATADLIRARFGDRVTAIVLACTDSLSADSTQKPPWETRKQQHIDKLRLAGREVALVTVADKLHNLAAMLRDVRQHGPGTLKRFSRPDRLHWYFNSVADALEAHKNVVPLADLRSAAAALAEEIRA